jgi:hypothetical protein
MGDDAENNQTHHDPQVVMAVRNSPRCSGLLSILLHATACDTSEDLTRFILRGRYILQPGTGAPAGSTSSSPPCLPELDSSNASWARSCIASGLDQCLGELFQQPFGTGRGGPLLLHRPHQPVGSVSLGNVATVQRVWHSLQPQVSRPERAPSSQAHCPVCRAVHGYFHSPEAGPVHVWTGPVVGWCGVSRRRRVRRGLRWGTGYGGPRGRG